MTELVTDRTGPGSYDWRDYNRVQAAAAHLQEGLTAAGYAVDLAPMPTWTRADIPTPGQLADYLANVKNLRDVLAAEVTLPDTMARLTWQGANAIEEALRQVEELLEAIKAVYQRAGTPWAYGGVGFYFGTIKDGDISEFDFSALDFSDVNFEFQVVRAE